MKTLLYDEIDDCVCLPISITRTFEILSRMLALA